MFNQFATELNLHILSFLSDRELTSCARVCKLANSGASLMHKERMKAFSIGRQRQRALCLLNPELAKFGIDIDSRRERYLLLKKDICDIALINEDVARYILNNAQLQRARRLDKDFSVVICKYFPQLATRLFSQENILMPNSEEMIDAISRNPDLFLPYLQTRDLSS